MSAWAAFWLFLAVFVCCECYLYDKGHDTLFWSHKTPAELAIQKAKIQKLPAAEQVDGNPLHALAKTTNTEKTK